MKTILLDPKIRVWCLSGLTGLVLMAGMLLEEGQARTYASSPTHTSTQGNTLNGHTRSAELMNIEQSPAQKTSPKQKRNVPTMQKEGADNNPGKKRMGLAILFLGILAKES